MRMQKRGGVEKVIFTSIAHIVRTCLPFAIHGILYVYYYAFQKVCLARPSIEN